MKRSIFALFFLTSAAFAQTVTPRIVDPRGGVVVQIRGAGITCKPYCRITFDGIPSPNVTEVGFGDFDAEAPPHAEGVATIVISGPFVLKTIERQFGYDVPREPILVPMFTDVIPGPSGTLWTTELWVQNDSDRDVTLQPAVCLVLPVGLANCSGDRLIVKANSARRVPARHPYEPNYVGDFLRPPRDAGAQLHFDLRVVDAARLGSGTALPILRESDLHRGKLTMLNVPGDTARFRKRLRIYVFWPALYAVRVYDLESGLLLNEQELTPQMPTEFGGPFVLNADVDGRAARLRVEVESSPPDKSLALWAFISVTDNVTQQVTVITPQ